MLASQHGDPNFADDIADEIMNMDLPEDIEDADAADDNLQNQDTDPILEEHGEDSSSSEDAQPRKRKQTPKNCSSAAEFFSDALSGGNAQRQRTASTSGGSTAQTVPPTSGGSAPNNRVPDTPNDPTGEIPATRVDGTRQST